MKNKNQISGQIGSDRGSITVVLIAMSVLVTMIVFGLIKGMQQQNLTGLKSQAYATQKDIFKRLNAAALDPGSFMNSATATTGVYSNLGTLIDSCVWGGKSTVCLPVANVPFYFYAGTGFGPNVNPIDFSMTGSSTATPLAGSKNGGPTVYYDVHGDVCATPSGTCVLEALATYTATCSSTNAGGNVCAQGGRADSISVQFTVQAIPGNSNFTLGLTSLASASYQLPVIPRSTASPSPTPTSLPIPLGGIAGQVPVWLGVPGGPKSDSFTFSGVQFSTDQWFQNPGPPALPGSATATYPCNGFSCSFLSFPGSLNAGANAFSSGVIFAQGGTVVHNATNTSILNVNYFGADRFNVSGLLTIDDQLTSLPGAVGVNTGQIITADSAWSPLFLYLSDVRKKKEILTIMTPEEELSKIHGYQFKSKLRGVNDDGFIAQEVETVYPALVHTDAAGMKSVKYGNVSAVLIEAIRQRKEKFASSIASQKNELKILEKRILDFDRTVRKPSSTKNKAGEL